jgi:hypothetical protein
VQGNLQLDAIEGIAYGRGAILPPIISAVMQWHGHGAFLHPKN